MMKKIFYVIIFLVLFVITSCELGFMDKEPGTEPEEIFEQVWKFTDENYSFFEFKDINWDSVKTVYETKIYDQMNDEALFDTLANMLYLLRDGHVNLSSSFNRSRNWSWYLDYLPNHDADLIQRNYFQDQQQYVGPFQLMDFGDVGYIYYGSFMKNVSQSNMDYVKEKFKNHKGLIIDVRNNGGGSILNVYAIANNFVDKEIDAAYEIYKNGPGHNDFGGKKYLTLSPVEDSGYYEKPVVILTNRLCYSATNFMVTLMKSLSNVTIIGDRTGGGGGIPTYTELSNGWTLRVSSTQLFTLEDYNVEDGIDPDIKVDQTEEDTANGKDTLLETALAFLRENIDNVKLKVKN